MALRTRLGQGVALALAALAALGAAWAKGYSRARSSAKTDNLKNEVKAHDRINEADIGVGATDDERRKRLRDIADKWGGN